MTRRDTIRSAYKSVGDSATIYDGMMTCSTFLGRAISQIVWKIGPEENTAYLERAMEGVPIDFAGSMLEVPVGTGVLTMPLYQSLPSAQITCLDYSPDMMATAQARAKAQGITNVSFVQGDVGALPYPDESFDLVLSLNGFHAFPDKEAAFAETYRVLKPGGTFCGCFYVAGEVGRTDWFINHLYVPKHFFTPPFETQASLRTRLEGMYGKMRLECIRSEACFACVK